MFILPVNANHLHNICTIEEDLQMLCKCYVFTGSTSHVSRSTYRVDHILFFHSD